MNTFFYSPKAATCRGGCRYQSCPQRCLHVLRNMPALREMVVLHGSMHSIQPCNVELRSGDLVILYAATWCEYEQLISMQDIFESFRVIFVMGSPEFHDDERYYQLKPRYTTTLDAQLAELESVISKIMHIACHDSAGEGR